MHLSFSIVNGIYPECTCLFFEVIVLTCTSNLPFHHFCFTIKVIPELLYYYARCKQDSISTYTIYSNKLHLINKCTTDLRNVAPQRPDKTLLTQQGGIEVGGSVQFCNGSVNQCLRKCQLLNNVQFQSSDAVQFKVDRNRKQRTSCWSLQHKLSFKLRNRKTCNVKANHIWLHNM